MKNVVLGMVLGLIIGVAAGWVASSITAVKPLEKQLFQQTADSQFCKKQIDQLGREISALNTKTQAEMSEAHNTLEEKDAEVTRLKEVNEKLIRAADASGKESAAAKENAGKESAAKETQPEDSDAEFVKEALQLMKQITPIGGPLNEKAVEDLKLNENQVAGINDALKEEAKRMHDRLVEWAAGILEGKTAADLADKSALEISVLIMPSIQQELESLGKLSSEDRRAITLGQKHFIKFLPKDAHLVKIAKAFHEERQKTYVNMAPFVNNEQEKLLKDKFFPSGTFVFSGGASYGIGKLSAEDFEE